MILATLISKIMVKYNLASTYSVRRGLRGVIYYFRSEDTTKAPDNTRLSTVPTAESSENNSDDINSDKERFNLMQKPLGVQIRSFTSCDISRNLGNISRRNFLRILRNISRRNFGRI